VTDPIRLPASDGTLSPSLEALCATLRTATGPTVVIADDLVVAPAALAPVTLDPFAGTSMLVRPSGHHGNVRVRHHVVTSVGTSCHDVTAPDHVSVGAMVIAGKDAGRAADEIAALAHSLTSGEITAGDHDAVELVAVSLVRGEISVKAVDLVDVPWFRSPGDVEAAYAAARSISNDRITRLQANRVDDGFYSTFVVRRLSKPLTRVALRLGMSPNLVTVISFIIGIGAATSFAVGERWGLVLGAVLLQLSLIVDCVDGEVARATRRFTALGAWLDASTDRVKEFLAYAGLAYGAAHTGMSLWWVAVLLVVLQTTRHMTDYDFSRVQRLREAHVPRLPLSQRDDAAAGSAGGWSVSGAMEFSTRINRRDAVRWAKRALHMPIGERWLVISVLAAVLGAAWALGGLLVLVAVAFAYVIIGRTLRTMTWVGSTPSTGALMLRRQADGGPLIAIFGQRPGVWNMRFAWAVPALLRFVELGLVALVALAWVPSAIPVAFWWMAVVAFHHYDTLYRALQDSATPRWLTRLALGWDGRSLLVIGLTATGVLAVGLTWGAWLLAAIVVALASVQWLFVQSRQR
jgi:phosphatidylglycerophosphate synthase